jgi:hypothetical protein
MVQATEQTQSDNPTLVQRLGGAQLRAILIPGIDAGDAGDDSQHNRPAVGACAAR